jgi:transposase InsO family protein
VLGRTPLVDVVLNPHNDIAAWDWTSLSGLYSLGQQNAIGLPNPAGTVVHSDRASHFRFHAYVRTLKHNGLLGSIGRWVQNVPRAATHRCSKSSTSAAISKSKS